MAMPTLECLDERTRAILQRINEMDENLTNRHIEFKEMVSGRLAAVESDVLGIKLEMAKEDGKKSVALWVGGIALTALSAIFGAIGNILYSWMIGPHGPMSLK